jgi:hypothetical protein
VADNTQASWGPNASAPSARLKADDLATIVEG